MISKYEELSPAEWFRRNKSIAGFDNPARAIYTAIREMVENSLDACEEGGILPEILVWVKEKEEGLFQIYVADNGIGVPEKAVPKAFAKLLVGTKYTLKQSRGTFGLGGKMAIMYGQITTGKPFKVITSTDGKKAYYFLLKIDIQKNEPIVLEKKKIEITNGWHGTIVSFQIVGDWYRAKTKLIQYFKNTGIVAPYANITFIDPDGVLYFFRRTINELPPKPKEVKPHPYGVDIETLNRMIKRTKAKNLVKFMVENFHRVGPKKAQDFIKHCGLDPNRNPKTLTDKEKRKMIVEMKNFKFLPPTADSLSPLGEKILQEGIRKELAPEKLAVTQRPPRSYMGHPFIVEVGLAYGGKVSPASNGRYTLYRFANRIPLLYDESNDVAMSVIREDINWSDYMISRDAPLAVVVHICSTKIPYKTAGKEYVADIPEIRREIKLGIQECARELRMYLSKLKRKQLAEKRFMIISKFVDKFVTSLVQINKTDKKVNKDFIDENKLKEILINKIKVE
ncbi:MAG: DNA topoisomerase VI subunit B [Candidatus Asgardarchaeia archaeon]